MFFLRLFIVFSCLCNFSAHANPEESFGYYTDSGDGQGGFGAAAAAPVSAAEKAPMAVPGVATEVAPNGGFGPYSYSETGDGHGGGALTDVAVAPNLGSGSYLSSYSETGEGQGAVAAAAAGVADAVAAPVVAAASGARAAGNPYLGGENQTADLGPEPHDGNMSAETPDPLYGDMSAAHSARPYHKSSNPTKMLEGDLEKLDTLYKQFPEMRPQVFSDLLNTMTDEQKRAYDVLKTLMPKSSPVFDKPFAPIEEAPPSLCSICSVLFGVHNAYFASVLPVLKVRVFLLETLLETFVKPLDPKYVAIQDYFYLARAMENGVENFLDVNQCCYPCCGGSNSSGGNSGGNGGGGTYIFVSTSGDSSSGSGCCCCYPSCCFNCLPNCCDLGAFCCQGALSVSQVACGLVGDCLKATYAVGAQGLEACGDALGSCADSCGNAGDIGD